MNWIARFRKVLEEFQLWCQKLNAYNELKVKVIFEKIKHRCIFVREYFKILQKIRFCSMVRAILKLEMDYLVNKELKLQQFAHL